MMSLPRALYCTVNVHKHYTPQKTCMRTFNLKHLVRQKLQHMLKVSFSSSAETSDISKMTEASLKIWSWFNDLKLCFSALTFMKCWRAE